MKKALVIMFNKVEEIEALTPVDILRRANVEVVTASLEEGNTIIGRSGITIECNESFADVSKSKFDAIILPGGAGVYDWQDYLPLVQTLKSQFAQNKIIGAICAAPIVLKKAGILDGKKCTGHSSIHQKLVNCDISAKVVVDSNIVTSQGAGTALEFALALTAILTGENTANDVAKSISFIN